MKTIDEVFALYKDDPCFRWVISSVDLTDDEIDEFLRVHECNATSEEAISFLAGMIADVPDDQLEATEAASIAGDYKNYFAELCRKYEESKKRA